MSEGKSNSLDRSRWLLEQLGWQWTAQQLPELIELGIRENKSLCSFVELLAGSEQEHRQEQRICNWLKRSGLPVGKTLEDFDWLFAHGVDRSRVEMLATCEFARRAETVLILGPSGVGKTHIAAGLGVKAIENGFAVYFILADDLIELLRRDEHVPGSRAKRRRYMTAKVLIIDELGFQALDRQDAHRLFRLINHRYELGSTIITSNKSIREWPGMLAGDEALASATLDRLLHHCHVLQIDGASYRLREIARQIDMGQLND